MKLTTQKVYIPGHKGMLGSACVRLLEKKYPKVQLLLRSRQELDLLNQADVLSFFKQEKPDSVILCAARVGGIKANIENPGVFLYDNLQIQNNVIHAAHLNDIQKFVFIGSSCVYPRECPQPMKESSLMTGPLEPTNEGYAVAKIAGLKMVEYYAKQYGFPGISLMPCNLYGTNDHFDLSKSHVLSALVRRFVDAVDDNLPDVTLWGTGVARREFMHVDDAAEAIIYFLENYEHPTHLNIGWGEDVTIKELANLIRTKTGFKGTLNWDTSKPDGMMRKCLDVSAMRSLGFNPSIDLESGIAQTIKEYRQLKGARP